MAIVDDYVGWKGPTPLMQISALDAQDFMLHQTPYSLQYRHGQVVGLMTIKGYINIALNMVVTLLNEYIW